MIRSWFLKRIRESLTRGQVLGIKQTIWLLVRSAGNRVRDRIIIAPRDRRAFRNVEGAWVIREVGDIDGDCVFLRRTR